MDTSYNRSAFTGNTFKRFYDRNVNVLRNLRYAKRYTKETIFKKIILYLHNIILYNDENDRELLITLLTSLKNKYTIESIKGYIISYHDSTFMSDVLLEMCHLPSRDVSIMDIIDKLKENAGNADINEAVDIILDNLEFNQGNNNID